MLISTKTSQILCLNVHKKDKDKQNDFADFKENY